MAAKTRGPGPVLVRNTFFPGIGNVVRAGAFKNFFHAIAFPAIFRVHGNENVAAFYFTFVLLRLIFGNAETNQRPRKPAERSPHTRPSQCGHNRAGRDGRPYAWDC